MRVRSGARGSGQQQENSPPTQTLGTVGHMRSDACVSYDPLTPPGPCRRWQFGHCFAFVVIRGDKLPTKSSALRLGHVYRKAISQGRKGRIRSWYTRILKHVVASSHPAFTAAGQSPCRIWNIHAFSQHIHTPSAHIGAAHMPAGIVPLGNLRAVILCLEGSRLRGMWP